jgi:hypothetical protein
MNNQNMMVFSVELGFTALPHLPDLPARGIVGSPAHQNTIAGTSTSTFLRISIAPIY